MENLNNKTLLELQEIAKALEIKGYSKYKKAELAQLISETMPKEERSLPQADAEDMIIDEEIVQEQEQPKQDTTQEVCGIMDVLGDGYGFLRGENYLSTSKDVYVSPTQIKRFNLKKII